MVGYITASMKNVKDTRVGDTVTNVETAVRRATAGLQESKSDGLLRYCIRQMVPSIRICGMHWRSFSSMTHPCQFEPETSVALGFGFRCGFLGLLHLEIIQERLEREYNLDLVTTAPGVIYKVHKTNGEVIDLTNPSNLPDPSEIEYMEEPMVSAEIMVTT